MLAAIQRRLSLAAYIPVLGLDRAGKSDLLDGLLDRLDCEKPYESTLGPRTEHYTLHGAPYVLCELGQNKSQTKLPSAVLKAHLRLAHGLIYVLDGAEEDTFRLNVTISILAGLLQDSSLTWRPILVLYNKVDSPQARESLEDLAQRLGLPWDPTSAQPRRKTVRLQPCSLHTHLQGVKEGLEWLHLQI